MLSLRRVEHFLENAERSIALLERCRPTNAVAELARVADAWERGHEPVPSFDYASPPSLGEVIRVLAALADRGADLGEWGTLYAERASELLCEAELAEQVGKPAFRAAAARRFPHARDAWGRLADLSAKRWIRQEPIEPEGPRIPSDSDDPRSLVNALRRTVGARRLPVRVVVCEGLSAVAAVGSGVVYVRAGVPLTVRDSQRLVTHEIDGHVAPRVAAARAGVGLLRVGTAGASADEEGRALLLEKRARLVDPRRRRQLAERHLAAVALRDGATWVEAARALVAHGTSRRVAAEVTARVFRGGGLAREIVYLSALRRVEGAFAESPALERWFEKGRVSVDASRRLEALGAPPDRFAPLPARRNAGPNRFTLSRKHRSWVL
jgi:hypothetical protein